MLLLQIIGQQDNIGHGSVVKDYSYGKSLDYGGQQLSLTDDEPYYEGIVLRAPEPNKESSFDHSSELHA